MNKYDKLVMYFTQDKEKAILFIFTITLFFIPLFFNTYTDGISSYINLHYSLIILLLFSFYSLVDIYIQKKEINLDINSVDILYTFWMIFVIFSDINHQNGIILNDYFQTQSLFFILYWFLKSRFHHNDSFRILQFIFLLMGIFFVIDSIDKLLVPLREGVFNFSIAAGTFSNPGIFSGYLCIIFPIIYSINSSNTTNRIIPKISTVISVLIFIIVCITKSRAGLISIISSFLFISYLYIKRTSKTTFRRFISISLFVSIPILIYLFYSKQNSFNGRALILKLTLQLCNTTPFCGYGAGKFDVLYNNYQIQYFFKPGYTEQEWMLADIVHFAFNEYLQHYIEFGIPGVLILGSILFKVFFLSSSHKYKYYLRGSLLAIFIFAFFSYPFHIYSILLVLVTIVSILSSSFKPIFSIKLKQKAKAVLIWSTIVILSFNLIFQIYQIKLGHLWKEGEALVEFHPRKALGIYNRIYSELNENSIFLLKYGVLLHKMSQYEKSILVLNSSMKKITNYASYVYQAKNYLSVNNDLAENYYIHAKYLTPSRLFPKYDLMLYYIQKNDICCALKEAKDILNARIKIKSIEASTIKNEASKFYNLNNSKQCNID